MLTPENLICEYFTNPIGLDVPQPRLSWQVRANHRGARQTAFQILVMPTMDETAVSLWDTGKVPSDNALHVPYGGLPLPPGQRCYWQVRVWDEHDVVSAWSETAFWEMGLLHSGNWQAIWITPAWDEDASRPQPAPMLRRPFKAEGDIVAARIYATSLGLYELRLNGQRVGNAVLTPGWTSYEHRLQYQTYDVTELVQAGDNVLGAVLGEGWYRGYMGHRGHHNLYGDRLALLVQLQLTYANGRIQVISSDEKWRATRGPIQMSDLYMGEIYDARLEKPGWD
ncbi:MAG: alpha-L-rhamnosidase N-terminal domain-containing protein, partial [Anaerolineales bacterium]|nr:alpha-L-rhamnosidase N-terminal domain-containing protein [Anaerolineales bacterium]